MRVLVLNCLNRKMILKGNRKNKPEPYMTSKRGLAMLVDACSAGGNDPANVQLIYQPKVSKYSPQSRI
jgi:hypothetical protein